MAVNEDTVMVGRMIVAARRLVRSRGMSPAAVSRRAMSGSCLEPGAVTVRYCLREDEVVWMAQPSLSGTWGWRRTARHCAFGRSG